MRRRASLFFFSLLLLLLAVMAGCAQEEFPGGPVDASVGTDAVTVSSSPVGPQFCQQAQAQALPQRLEAIGSGADAGAEGGMPAGQTYLVSDLLNKFNSACGGCHGTITVNGNFQIASQEQFVSQFQAPMTPSILDHVTSNGGPNDADPMPPFSDRPFGMPYSQRPESDPIRQFAELTQAWITAGFPPSFQYSLPGEADTGGSSTVPVPSAQMGNAMTNIGNCIPTATLVNTEQAKAAELDAMFAAATAAGANGATAAADIGLPLHLSDTDLFTLDSATLARYGVIAYAPGYPLWSDNAGKLRYIRVPRGTSVHFDKATQEWTIPPNTRFYKTFMKQVIDSDGSYRYRKMETRLIVSRPDPPDQIAATNYQPTALFATYKWNDDESDAELEQSALHDGLPFTDDLLLYATNEPAAAAILATNPADPDDALVNAGAARHYAIPSSQRCIQCHQGSVTHSFVLGFLPLQINRRPVGQGGTIEATGPDELTQLQRFINYGLITGMDSPADVLPLEQSEGTRTPRNDYELRAQGYLLGNCSHCHNPTGYPSRQNPVLVGDLDFYPMATGGIFQFPLDRVSQRIARGVNGQTKVPYITPSLMDHPRTNPDGSAQVDPFSNGASALIAEWFAPWRSLLYRNVDNPFAYADDSNIFPHMPMNTPGYDPRAKQIVSDWMVSIPAIRKSPDIPEYAFVTGQATQPSPLGAVIDNNDQPYVEVLPGDPRYASALDAANVRLALLHTGNPGQTINEPLDPAFQAMSHYADPGAQDDIVDPYTQIDPTCHQVPLAIQPTGLTSIQIPDHCDWPITDTTQAPPPWSPRRADWANQLILNGAGVPALPEPATAGDAGSQNACPDPPATELQAQEDQSTAIQLLQNIHLDDNDAGAFLQTPQPFGIWKGPSGCNYTGQHPVSWYNGQNGPGSETPMWLDSTNDPTPPATNALVYTQTPGQAIFKMICINCHGPLADSTGRFAANLAIMTGGHAEVADFRDGLFGPQGAAADTTDIHLVFGDGALQTLFSTGTPPPSWTSATEDDRAARYLSWMALGGTLVKIPPVLLQLVGGTPVLGISRSPVPDVNSANMLAIAIQMCEAVLSPAVFPKATSTAPIFDPLHPLVEFDKAGQSPLIFSNGDADLWLRLCSLNNPPPIHVVGADDVTHEYLGTNFPQVGAPFDPSAGGAVDFLVEDASLFTRGPSQPPYPVGNFGNSRGIVDTNGIQPDNIFPWCHYAPPGQQDMHPDWPKCPDTMIPITQTDFQNWVVRGAINAGLAVFDYLKCLETHQTPPPDYTDCPTAADIASCPYN